MIQDWDAGSLTKPWRFLKADNSEVRPMRQSPDTFEAYFKGVKVGMFWDKARPALACQMGLGCVERAWQDEQAALELVRLQNEGA